MNRWIFVLIFVGTLLLPGEKRFTKISLPNGKIITAELAVTDEERARGLMFRKEIPDDFGMLFIFEREERHGFWMKNTLIPLDMLWLDGKKRIVHIEENVPPCNVEPCEVYYPLKPGLYVLELNAGKARKEGLRVGDVLLFKISQF